jgi:predicted MFS family arabinose efflux permease
MLLGHATGLFGLFAAAAVLGLGFGALSPAFQTLAVLSAPSDRSGVATATYFWSLDISVGLAALVLSPVVEVWGYPFLYGVILVAVIAATAACYALLRHRVARREI